jgi:hypothetical protein
MLDISRWPNTEGISFQNIPLIISQDDWTQNENVSLRSFYVPERFDQKKKKNQC